MIKKFWIKGHETRGNEVIKMLEDLGGKNVHSYRGDGDQIYYINPKSLEIRADNYFDRGTTAIMWAGEELKLPEQNQAESTVGWLKLKDKIANDRNQKISLKEHKELMDSQYQLGFKDGVASVENIGKILPTEPQIEHKCKKCKHKGNCTINTNGCDKFEPAQKPEPKFKVGDKVRNIGIAKIYTIKCIQYDPKIGYEYLLDNNYAELLYL